MYFPFQVFQISGRTKGMICSIYYFFFRFLLSFFPISVSLVVVARNKSPLRAFFLFLLHFRTASGTFHDGNLLLNQKGLRLVSEEKETQVSLFYFKHPNLKCLTYINLQPECVKTGLT